MYSKWCAPTIGGLNGAKLVAAVGDENIAAVVDDTPAEPVHLHTAFHFRHHPHKYYWNTLYTVSWNDYFYIANNVAF